ncbi:hypothetical protein ABZ934_23705 [Streptomyces sp. NPDC046557]|uniref:hypothetical protein n=1 Tax=Streptomyces sp. NPDC046557 TaxID=3155372 RepID=UPI0033C5EDF9
MTRHWRSGPSPERELIEPAPNLPDDSYRRLLIDHACAGPGLPAELVAAARRIHTG